MTNVSIRECARQDLEGVFELDKLWREEGVAHIWYGSRDDVMAAFDRFQNYFLVAESDGRIVGYINGSIRTNETVNVLPIAELAVRPLGEARSARRSAPRLGHVRSRRRRRQAEPMEYVARATCVEVVFGGDPLARGPHRARSSG